MSEAPLVFLDTETTGVHSGRKVWEIGMIRREGGSEAEIQFFIDVDLRNADPFGLNVGKFYERHPYGKFLAGKGERPTKHDLEAGYLWDDDAVEIIAEWTHGAHIVGAVPNFDTEVLAKMLRRRGLIPAWHYHLVDVETLAAGTLGLEPPWDFDKVLAAYGLEYNKVDRHTALGDAHMARKLYDAVIAGDRARVDKAKVQNIEQLLDGRANDENLGVRDVWAAMQKAENW